MKNYIKGLQEGRIPPRRVKRTFFLLHGIIRNVKVQRLFLQFWLTPQQKTHIIGVEHRYSDDIVVLTRNKLATCESMEMEMRYELDNREGL